MDCFVRKYFSFLLPVFTIPNVVRFFMILLKQLSNMKRNKNQNKKQKNSKTNQF